MPFGEDINVGIGGRTGDTGQKYTSTQDDVRQKFTGYQKDAETSLDFAEARMYENRHGRFTVVDPESRSMDFTNPQTFNRFVYVLNRPLVMIDPTGEIGDYYTRGGQWLRSDGKDDKKVYVSTPVKTDGKIVWEDRLLKGITIDQFRTLANIVKLEGVTKDPYEYLYIAHSTNNEARATNSTMYATAMSGFSSVKKGDKVSLSDGDKSSIANIARASVIHVLEGGADPTNNARRWDGTDFLAWGLRSPNGTPHNKFEEFAYVAIPEAIYKKYAESQNDAYGGSVRYSGKRYPLPEGVFIERANWKTVNGKNYFFYKTGTGGRKCILATAAAGRSIFWKIRTLKK